VRGRALLGGICALACLGGAAPARADATAERLSCTLLVAGAAGLPELLSAPVLELLRKTGDPALIGPAAPAGLLPDRVDLRTPTQTFNTSFFFALREGRIWFRPRGAGGGPWRRMPLPACFGGKVEAISADGNLLVAVDGGRRIYTMDNARQNPLAWNWTSRFGPPLWVNASGQKIPADANGWQLSALSSVEDETWTDPAGHEQTVGGGNVTTVYALRGDRRRITILDPWLPNDYSYEECGPERGRLEMEALAASGSTVFVTDRYGDLYTRLWDFDISGADNVFFRYTYEDQSGKPVPRFSLPSWFPATGIPGLDALPIQLPAPGWVKQPKVPGEITSALTIFADGAGSANRVLRVEGRDDGETGYWEKRIGGGSWTFHPTGEPLSAEVLDNGPDDASTDALGPSTGLDFVRPAGDGFSASVLDFTSACTPSTLRVTVAGAPPFDLVLHTVDALRQEPRAEGLAVGWRQQLGTIEVPPALLEPGVAEPVKVFIARWFGAKRFTATDVSASAEALVLAQPGWRLER
jgi:hypothetical protein